MHWHMHTRTDACTLTEAAISGRNGDGNPNSCFGEATADAAARKGLCIRIWRGMKEIDLKHQAKFDGLLSARCR